MKLFVSWRLRRAAKKYFGWPTLRPGQLAAMKTIATGRDAVVVLPTGAGKSAVYQVPASVADTVPTIVISPLLALQHDQVAGLNARGRAGACARSGSARLRPRSSRPRRWRDPRRRGPAAVHHAGAARVAGPAGSRSATLRPALVAVDEAHCLSTWGHDFRPDYLALGPVIEALGRPPIVALTATASPPVRDDIAARLRLRDPAVVIGALDRPNLFLEAVHCPTEEQRWRRLRTHARRPGRLRHHLRRHPARRRGTDRAPHRRRLSGRVLPRRDGRPALRKKRHEEFAADQIPIMVATSAFGMGIDKPNIRWVAHMALPDSPDSYLQEIGRAGRDGAPARVLLLFRAEDMALQRFFSGGSPAIDELLFVAAAVHAGVRTKTEIATKTSLSARKVAALLEPAGDDRRCGARRAWRGALPAVRTDAGGRGGARRRRARAAPDCCSDRAPT